MLSSPAMSLARAALVTIRPHQWVKNLFVAVPLVFAKKLLDESAIGITIVAVAAFCLLSSAVYVANDIVDRDRDRAHPLKCRRPIASGILPVRTAIVVAAVLAGIALSASVTIGSAFLGMALLYLCLNVAYSWFLKEIPFLDVTTIAVGFLLRVLAGALALSVPASPWLLACTVLLAAFLGFGKRAHELTQATAAGLGGSQLIGATRKVLVRYRPSHLRLALYASAVLTTLAYVLYTKDSRTVSFFGHDLLWTAPFCAIGIGRFLVLATGRPHLSSPTEAMLLDVPFVANMILWALAVIALVYC
ncbi:MAG: decaprenyl-phosphate phosphoribosyltransferase [Pseudomonadota bacterium]